MSHPSASTGDLLDWWTSACCLLAPRTCLILLDWAAPLPDLVHQASRRLLCAARLKHASSFPCMFGSARWLDTWHAVKPHLSA
eukprot:357030-Chlamydomonas_euryale.AAC.2